MSRTQFTYIPEVLYSAGGEEEQRDVIDIHFIMGAPPVLNQIDRATALL